MSKMINRNRKLQPLFRIEYYKFIYYIMVKGVKKTFLEKEKLLQLRNELKA